MKVIIKKTATKPSWLLINSPQLQQFNVIVGWDTEYRNREWKLDLKAHEIVREIELTNYEEPTARVKALVEAIDQIDLQRTKESLYNDVISHQIVAYSRDLDVYKELIIYLYDSESRTFENKITLAKLLSIVCEELGYQYSALNNLKFLLLAHFSVAEFSTLPIYNRKELANCLTVIQKTLSSASFFKQIIQKYASMSINVKKHVSISKINVLWRDTILLAPVSYKSLKKLASTTSHAKLDLLSVEYINMVDLLHNNQAKYEEYAINDALITLEFYCKFMETYHFIITDQLVSKLPMTAVGSTELNFLAQLAEDSRQIFDNDAQQLRKLVFGMRSIEEKIESRENDESLVDKCYLGGRNNISRYYRNLDCRNINKIAIDIDLSGAYGCSFGLLPLPNWNTRNKRVISNEKYTRDIAQQYNKQLNFTKIGFFYTKFKFEDIYEPILPQRTEWGLIYTKKGTTRATFPEMMEASRWGAIKDEDIKELIVYDELLIDKQVYLPFAPYIAKMIKERRKYPKGSFEDLLYKLQINGLYGKTGQGIEDRKFFSLKGEEEHLKPSRITCAEYASHITGVIRTVLGAIINEIERFPGCEVIHWTTDGLVFLMDKDAPGSLWKDKEYPEFKVWKEDEEYKYEEGNSDKTIGKIRLKDNNKLSLREVNKDLYQKLTELRIIQLLIAGRKNIGLNNEDEWIEIKALGDQIGSETTRGNWITWKGVTQSLARGNIGSKIINTAEDFQNHSATEEIVETVIDNLVNTKEMVENGWDLVIRRKIEKGKQGKNLYRQSFRKINLGPDGKRKLLGDEINTEAFENITEASKYRATIEYMTRKEIRKSTTNVLWQTKTATIKKTRGNRKETVFRTIIALVLQRNLQHPMTYQKLVQLINEKKLFTREITTNDMKNWKRKEIPAHSIPSIGFSELAKDFQRITNIDISKINFTEYLV